MPKIWFKASPWILIATLSLSLQAFARPGSSSPRFVDLKTTFGTAPSFSGAYANQRPWVLWGESLFPITLKKNFEGSNSHGFAFSRTTVKFRQNLALLDQPIYQQARAQKVLFPNINYTDCLPQRCLAEQEVGPLLPNAHYVSHYQLLKFNSAQELANAKIPATLIGSGDRFPKYVMIQLATDWSQYFHRAISITVFEPEVAKGWIRINSYQTLSLTSVGAMGKGYIRSSLKKQVESFLIAFGKIN